MKRMLFILVVFCNISISNLYAQFVDGANGLLSMPSAEFYDDATFAITNNFLHKEYTPSRWPYNTFEYAFSITLWSRLDLIYVCTLFNGKWDPDYENLSDRYKIMFNQDRHFAARVAVTKENEWGKRWLPAITVGLSDPVTGSGGGEYIGSDVSGNSGNGFFNRYYVAVAKNFATPWGTVGAHLAYQYSQYARSHYNGVCAAMTWEPRWLNNDGWFMSRFRVTAEYDAYYVNFGINVSIWDNHFDFMAMMLGCRYPMAGIRYKLHLTS